MTTNNQPAPPVTTVEDIDDLLRQVFAKYNYTFTGESPIELKLAMALAAAVERERALEQKLQDAADTIRILHREKREDQEIADQRETKLIDERDEALARAQAAEREVGMLRGREQLAIEMCASATEPKLEARRLAAERETLAKGLQAAFRIGKGIWERNTDADDYRAALALLNER